MNSIKKGIWPTMITPYAQNGQVDGEAAARIVDWYAEKGCDGIFAVCQSSKMFDLTLTERVQLAQTVVSAAKGRLEVIASGHISDDPAAQEEELRALADTGVSAVVMVSNRLAAADEDDSVWIRRAEHLLDALPDVTFGLYECPYPYKRLMSEKTLAYCARSGRFAFLKDTCCDARLIRERLALIRREAASANAAPLQLYNANTLTLLESLRDGAAGFSGVMANLHPELYVWLYHNWRADPQRAEELQALLTLLSSLEAQGYPICAKQHMNDVGVPMTLFSRSAPPSAFGPPRPPFVVSFQITPNMCSRATVTTVKNSPSNTAAVIRLLRLQRRSALNCFHSSSSSSRISCCSLWQAFAFSSASFHCGMRRNSFSASR